MREPTKAELAAERETVIGYMAGLDLSNPEPSESRPFTYRLGFFTGRFQAQGAPLADVNHRLGRLAEERRHG